MCDDDDLIVAVAVDVPKCGDVAEGGHVTLEDPGAGWGIARGITKVGVDVEDNTEDGASAAGGVDEEDCGSERLAVDDGLGPLSECIEGTEKCRVVGGEIAKDDPSCGCKKDGGPEQEGDGRGGVDATGKPGSHMEGGGVVGIAGRLAIVVAVFGVVAVGEAFSKSAGQSPPSEQESGKSDEDEGDGKLVADAPGKRVGDEVVGWGCVRVFVVGEVIVALSVCGLGDRVPCVVDPRHMQMRRDGGIHWWERGGGDARGKNGLARDVAGEVNQTGPDRERDETEGDAGQREREAASADSGARSGAPGGVVLYGAPRDAAEDESAEGEGDDQEPAETQIAEQNLDGPEAGQRDHHAAERNMRIGGKFCRSEVELDDETDEGRKKEDDASHADAFAKVLVVGEYPGEETEAGQEPEGECGGDVGAVGV